MNTSQTGFLSEILQGGRIPPAKLAYFRERLRNRLHQFVLREFVARQREGLSQADLARVLGRRPEQINRWLGSPGNWEIDSISDLMLAISKSELDFKAEPLGHLLEPRQLGASPEPEGDDGNSDNVLHGGPRLKIVALDAIARKVLFYKPTPKSKPAKARKRRAAKIAKGKVK